MFLPGFWSEYGMCSEPTAFGSVCSFPVDEFPHAKKSILSVEDIKSMKKPNAEKDGLGPLILNRLLLNQKKIEDNGHNIYFSVSRGPLNIASYLMGIDEFLMAMLMNPEEIHYLLNMITDYLVEWHNLQSDAIPSIDGILVLDDILGFIGEEEFKNFALPYLKKIYNRDVSVKFLHNDADYTSSIKYLNEIGINLFNMGYKTSLNELKEITGNRITMMGNISPLETLTRGTPEQIDQNVNELITGLDDRKHVLFSCGGGMPPGVSSENIRQFVESVSKYS